MLAASVSLAGCGKASSANSSAPPALPVKTEIVRSQTIEDSSDYVAMIKSRDSAVISPQVDGQVVDIYVHSGDHVKAGTPLMQIDPLKQQATVRSQEGTRAAKVANVRYAQQQYERTRNLYTAGVVSKQALDEAQAAVDSAESELHALDAQLNEQQVQLRYYKVVAPREGIVGDIPVRVGDRVTNTTVLTTVDRPSDLELYVEVPIEQAPRLKMGLPVQAEDDSGKVLARGTIDFISPQVSTLTQTVLVKSRIPNPQGLLRTSQFARARIVWGSREGIVVPVLAVSRIGGQYFVFVAEQDQKGPVARQRPIQIGDISGNDYVVKDGLKAGEQVIVSGGQALTDGAPISPQK